MNRVAHPPGFEPGTPEVITLGTLTGLSYGCVVISAADTSTGTASTACGPSARFQGPSLVRNTARHPRCRYGAEDPHVPAFPPADRARARLSRSGLQHRWYRAGCPERIRQQRGSSGPLEYRWGDRRGRRSSASGTGTSEGQWDVFMAESMPVIFGQCKPHF